MPRPSSAQHRGRCVRRHLRVAAGGASTEGRPTSLGAASGLIAALFAITPACGAVSPIGALVIGAAAGALCCFAVSLKFRLGYDDALDVVGIHLVGGILGTLLIGLLATEDAPNGVAGLVLRRRPGAAG